MAQHDEHAAGQQADDAQAHAEVGHVVPVRILAAVLAALLVLTVVTVAASWFHMGRANLLIALVIAVVKASLVAMYFMHLRYDRPINAIILIVALVFVALFIGLAMMDTIAYQPDMIGGEAPDLARQ